MIAHCGNRTRRLGLRCRTNGTHQPRARPPCCRVIAGAILLWPLFAIGRERGIDQAFVERQDVFGTQAKPLADRSRKIRDEYVGARNQSLENSASVLLFEIERQALLVAIVEQPEIVVVAERHAVQLDELAVGVAGSRRLDLDYARAEIGHDGGGGRPRNKTCAIQNQQIFEQGHSVSSLWPRAMGLGVGSAIRKSVLRSV